MSDPAQTNQIGYQQINTNSTLPPADIGQSELGSPEESHHSQNSDPDETDGVGGVAENNIDNLPQAIGGMAKEAEPIRHKASETPLVIELDRQRELHEIEPDLQPYVSEKPGEHLNLKDSVVLDSQVLVKPVVPSESPEITLPMSESSYEQFKDGSTQQSGSWLAQLCKKLLAKFGSKARFENGASAE